MKQDGSELPAYYDWISHLEIWHLNEQDIARDNPPEPEMHKQSTNKCTETQTKTFVEK
jgi:hypothetical protein